MDRFRWRFYDPLLSVYIELEYGEKYVNSVATLRVDTALALGDRI